VEANAITEQAEEEAKGILSRAKAKASAMMAQAKDVLKKFPIINKMMVRWAEEQEPEDRKETEGVLDAMTQYGIAEPVKAVVESDEDAEQRQGMEVLQAMTMLTAENWTKPRKPQKLKAS
jgi:cell division septum initiation protein DivIVA